MGDLITLFRWIVETQGFVSGLLLVVIAQNYLYTRQLMTKNCEITHFLMECVKKDWDVDHPTANKESK